MAEQQTDSIVIQDEQMPQINQYKYHIQTDPVQNHHPSQTVQEQENDNENERQQQNNVVGEEDEIVTCCKCQCIPDNYIALNCTHNYCLECLCGIYQICRAKNTSQDKSKGACIRVNCELCNNSTELDAPSIEALEQTSSQQSQVSNNYANNNGLKIASSNAIHLCEVIMEDSREETVGTHSGLFRSQLSQHSVASATNLNSQTQQQLQQVQQSQLQQFPTAINKQKDCSSSTILSALTSSNEPLFNSQSIVLASANANNNNNANSNPSFKTHNNKINLSQKIIANVSSLNNEFLMVESLSQPQSQSQQNKSQQGQSKDMINSKSELEMVVTHSPNSNQNAHLTSQQRLSQLIDTVSSVDQQQFPIMGNQSTTKSIIQTSTEMQQQQDQNKIASPQAIICQYHPTQKATMLCFECKRSDLCLQCVQSGAHSSHVVQSFDQAPPYIRSALQALQSRMADKVKELKSADQFSTAQHEQYANQLDALRTELDQSILQCEALLQRKHQEISTFVDELAKPILNKKNYLWFSDEIDQLQKDMNDIDVIDRTALQPNSNNSNNLVSSTAYANAYATLLKKEQELNKIAKSQQQKHTLKQEVGLLINNTQVAVGRIKDRLNLAHQGLSQSIEALVCLDKVCQQEVSRAVNNNDANSMQSLVINQPVSIYQLPHSTFQNAQQEELIVQGQNYQKKLFNKSLQEIQEDNVYQFQQNQQHWQSPSYQNYMQVLSAHPQQQQDKVYQTGQAQNVKLQNSKTMPCMSPQTKIAENMEQWKIQINQHMLAQLKANVSQQFQMPANQPHGEQQQQPSTRQMEMPSYNAGSPPNKVLRQLQNYQRKYQFSKQMLTPSSKNNADGIEVKGEININNINMVRDKTQRSQKSSSNVPSSHESSHMTGFFDSNINQNQNIKYQNILKGQNSAFTDKFTRAMNAMTNTNNMHMPVQWRHEQKRIWSMNLQKVKKNGFNFQQTFFNQPKTNSNSHRKEMSTGNADQGIKNTSSFDIQKFLNRQKNAFNSNIKHK